MHTPIMHTPGGYTPGGYTPGGRTPMGGPPGNMGQKYPSMTSVHTMLSQGYLPPGHGFVPKPIKPDKPYGPTFVSVMNRTWRGPGRKYLNYAIFTSCVAVLFLLASGLYIGHRNVSRLIVLRTEVFGAIFTMIFILMVGLTIHLIYRARQESNKWRRHVRFRAEGLYHVVPYNPVYNPEDDVVLQTGTYGKKALKEIPKPGRRGRKAKKRRQQEAAAAAMASVAEEGGGGPMMAAGPRGPQYGGPPPGRQYTRPEAPQVGSYPPGPPPIYDRPMPLSGPPRGPQFAPQGPSYAPQNPSYAPPPPRGYIPVDPNLQRYGPGPGRPGGVPLRDGSQGESSL